MMTPREAAKQCITDCLARNEPLHIGVVAEYDGYRVQIGGKATHEGRERTYDQHLVLVCSKAGGRCQLFSVHDLLYEINAAHRPAMTPREAAKVLIADSVRRGVNKGYAVSKIVGDLQKLSPGHCWVDYWAQVGAGQRGTKNGGQRATRPDEILVKEVNRHVCNEIFDLSDIAEELHREFTQGTQLTLWEAK